MNDKINFIDMNEKLNHAELYSLFKTQSSKVNKQISKKIDIFKYNKNFFEFYSNKDIKNLLYIFDYKLSENNDESFSSFKSDIDQYISCISQIILSIKLFIKTQDILLKTFTDTKKHLSKLKYKHKLENYNQYNLFLYLESFLKITEKKTKFNSSASTELSSITSSFENNPINSLFQKYPTEYKIDDFSTSEKELIKYDSPPTPRFESESDDEFENQDKNNINLENSIENNTKIKKESVLTLSEFIFAEPVTPQNNELKLMRSSAVKLEPKNISFNGGLPQIENGNKEKTKRNIIESEFINKTQNKNNYRNLLEMILKINKKGLINSEEKAKLKELVIKKSVKMEYLYYNIYKNGKNDKKMLVKEIKKIIKSF